MNWLKDNKPGKYYAMTAIDSLVKKGCVRELGKIFAEPNEYIQLDWINKNTSVLMKKREEDLDKNFSGYDLCSVDGKLTIQSKLRYDTFHLEQTRRLSKKNLNESSKSGHVRYSIGEAHIYLFSKPKSKEDYVDILSWSFIAIPERELEDPKCQGYLRSNIPASIWKKYVGKAKEVIEEEYKRKLDISI